LLIRDRAAITLAEVHTAHADGRDRKRTELSCLHSALVNWLVVHCADLEVSHTEHVTQDTGPRQSIDVEA